jgi:hypothetical protein
VTSIATLAAGSDASAPSPTLLFGFDPGNEFSSAGHWAYGGGSTGSLSFSDVGHTCPGSLAATTNFEGMQYPILQQFLFDGTAGDWTGYTKLHAWIKVVMSPSTDIGSAGTFVQNYSFAHGFDTDGSGVTGASDQNWHESVLQLVPTAADAGSNGYDPGAINQFGVQAGAGGTAYSAADGGALPVATVYIDDIWLE